MEPVPTHEVIRVPPLPQTKIKIRAEKKNSGVMITNKTLHEKKRKLHYLMKISNQHNRSIIKRQINHKSILIPKSKHAKATFLNLPNQHQFTDQTIENA